MQVHTGTRVLRIMPVVSSGIMTVCIDPSGLGFLQSEYPLRDETMEYAQRRIRRIGRIMNWDCTYGTDG